jgi:D-alanyl-lipoteichoic acid acyltransferase DltB (MBOAT superfamily)
MHANHHSTLFASKVMLFNSYEFIFLFLPITFFIYFYLNNQKLIEASKVFLVASSLFFYSWWNIIYLPLLLGSMFFNYAIGASLAQEKHHIKTDKKALLLIGVTGNLTLLGYFKYADFFIENINYAFNSNMPILELALPLAISFFTFQQIAYLIDSYRQEVKEHDFLNYAVFVSFFPQLIAGPIVHHKEMMPQFSHLKNKIKHYHNIALGLFIFSIGLFKKVVIADTFSQWATNGFDVAERLNFIEAWITSLSYTFQLYFDFSGYTDMAIGVALLFNIRLPINFSSPYKATNIQDFWRRWHITLSRFLKDYIYIPLGGNKKSTISTYNNLIITFLLGGLWHGAAWTFVFWGGLHGVALVIYRMYKKLNIKLNKIVAWLITFNFINITWIFFRAKEWEDAQKVLKGMFTISATTIHESVVIISAHKSIILYLTIAFFLSLLFQNTAEKAKKFQPSLFNLIFISCITLISIGQLNEFSEFLYFNF